MNNLLRLSQRALKEACFVLVPALALTLSGCMVKGNGGGGPDGASASDASNGADATSSNGSSGSNASSGAGAIDPNAQYIPEQDPTKAQAIATRMWAVLTAPPCWNQHNTTNNYSFSGTNDYRYAGYETTAGQVILNSVGSYSGYDTADVGISYSQYWILVYDASTIAISSVQAGKLVVNWYTAASPGQYCA